MFRKIMLTVLAASVASCMSLRSLAAAAPTPELAITPEQAKELFGDLEAKMIIHYAPGKDPFGVEIGKVSPLFLFDFSEIPFRFQLICEDAMSGVGDPFISPDGTRVAYNNSGKIHVRELKPGGPGKTLVGEGYNQRWWFHPKTRDEHIIFTNRKTNNGDDFSGITHIRKLRKGTCEPQGEVEILVEKYALGDGRSPDGRYICGTQPGCAIVELNPDAVKDAFVRVVWSQGRKCNGSMIQDPQFSGNFCWLDPAHNRIITGPKCDLGDIYPPPPNQKIQWTEWSTHADYISASPSIPDDWEQPDVHDICIYQVSKKKWTTVAHKGRSTHLWVYTSPLTVSIDKGGKSGGAEGTAAVAAPAELPESCEWPGPREKLLFAWRNSKERTEVFDLKGTPVFDPAIFYQPTQRGLMRFDRYYALLAEGGALHAERAGAPVYKALREAGSFSIEVRIEPADLKQEEGVILALCTPEGVPGLILRQRGKKVVLVEGVVAGAGTKTHSWHLAEKKPSHIVATFKNGDFSIYVDGVQAASYKKDPASADNGKPRAASDDAAMGLFLGNDPALKHPWFGRMQFVSIYSRALTEKEVRLKYAAIAQEVAGRKPAKQLVVNAELVAASDIPQPGSIAPYRHAIGTYKFKVLEVVSGKYDAPFIVVARYVIMDAKNLAGRSIRPGERLKLTLEMKSENPHLETAVYFHTLADVYDLPEYYDIGPVSY